MGIFPRKICFLRLAKPLPCLIPRGISLIHRFLGRNLMGPPGKGRNILCRMGGSADRADHNVRFLQPVAKILRKDARLPADQSCVQVQMRFLCLQLLFPCFLKSSGKNVFFFRQLPHFSDPDTHLLQRVPARLQISQCPLCRRNRKLSCRRKLLQPHCERLLPFFLPFQILPCSFKRSFRLLQALFLLLLFPDGGGKILVEMKDILHRRTLFPIFRGQRSIFLPDGPEGLLKFPD